MQTTVAEFIANQNHKSSNRSSSTSHVNNNTTKATQPIHESHSLRQQQHNIRRKKEFLKKNLYHGRKLQQNNEIIETKAMKKRNCLFGI